MAAAHADKRGLAADGDQSRISVFWIPPGCCMQALADAGSMEDDWRKMRCTLDPNRLPPRCGPSVFAMQRPVRRHPYAEQHRRRPRIHTGANAQRATASVAKPAPAAKDSRQPARLRHYPVVTT